MRNPVMALMWECWRLARRWYLWVLPLAIFMDVLVMRQAHEIAANAQPGSPFGNVEVLYAVMGTGAFQLNFAIALMTTLLGMSIGGRGGFPLGFEYRLPVTTPLLVAVPMLTQALLCASLYFIPLLICRLVFGLPFPLLAGAVLIAALALVLLAAAWATTSSTARAAALLAGMVASLQLFSVLDPIRVSDGAPRTLNSLPRFNPDIVALSAGEYALLGGIALVLIALTAASVRRQRVSEKLRLNPFTARAQRNAVSLSGLYERVSDLVAVPCPVSTPSRAELWLELKRQIMPILLLSLLLAAAIPLVFALDAMPEADYLAGLDYLFPAAVLFAGVGLAVFHRRPQSGGYMSAFEAARGMHTLRLVLIQLLSVSGSTALGIGLVCLSVWQSARLLEEPGWLAVRLQELAATSVTPLVFVSEAFRQLVIYVSTVALLACVHTWSVIRGRWIPYAAGVVSVYGLIFALNIRNGRADLDDIKRHMWGFAIAVGLLTVLALARTLHLRMLSLRAGLGVLCVWTGFVACSLYRFWLQGKPLTAQASELQAFNSALLATPLLLFLLLLWSYDRLRHR